ncbi:2Fe-2S iron-sulfur cluster-binding protein [Streptomyces shenzhenensis]|uniref:2Fe-2S iron-sulfur cluster-binding protein n=1 Tax=Streptomyces shenzhenensis TaxID=943815 RepID=UPI0036AA998A
MTDDQHGENPPREGGRWNPLPQGDYDDGATAFVKLPEGGIDALLASDSPLAAPGHGYVPPQIAVAPAGEAGADPAVAGGWSVPADGAHWPDPNAVPQEPGAGDRFTYHPAAAQQWAYEEPAAPAPGQDVTGQWSIPVAGGDLPDESGEFSTSSLVEQWGGTPPATLPGGAPAPWATEAAGQPWGQQTAPAGPSAAPPRAGGQPAGGAPQPAPERFAPPAAYQDAPVGPEAAVPAADAPADHAPSAAALPAAVPGPAAAPGLDAATGAAPGAPAEHAAPQGPSEADAPVGHAPHGTAADPEATGAAEGAEEGPEGAAEPPAGAEATDDAVTGPEGAQPPGTPDGSTASAEDSADAPPPPHDDHPLASYVLRVNGTDRPVTDAWIGESLLYVLRERLGLAGAKDGCSQGECGACNVQVDGRLVASCLVPAVTAAGSEVRTVEGLAADGRPSDVQRALARRGAVQCGFCIPGMAMTVHDLLEGNPVPTELEARQALCGNLCRCSGYRGVLDAVQEVVAEREAHSAADAEPDADGARIPHQAGPGAGGVHPSLFEAQGSPGPHDQPYGQDGGQA